MRPVSLAPPPADPSTINLESGFAPDEAAQLERYFTNLDRDVFAL